MTIQQKNQAEDSIDADELKHHLTYIEAALDSKTKEEHRQALIEGMLRFGLRFGTFLSNLAHEAKNTPLSEQLQDLFNEYQELFRTWFGGKQLTKQADESARRAIVAHEILESGEEFIDLWDDAARLILKLPKGHPLRNVDLVHQALLKYLEHCKAKGDIDSQVRAIGDILDYKLESTDRSLELILQGQQLLSLVYDIEIRFDFQDAVMNYYMQLAIEERDKGNTVAQQQWVEKAEEAEMILDRMIAESPEISPDMAKNLLDTASLLEMMGKPAKAADTFALIVNARNLQYLFSWDNIPGNDNGRLIDFLKQDYSIDWVKKAKIEKIDSGKTIRLSIEKNYLSLSLNDEKTKVNLKIDDCRTDEFITKMENGKLNIYLQDRVGCLAAMHEGRLRLGLGEYERAIQVLSPIVPIFEERYLTEVEDTAVSESGAEFSDVVTYLAFAHAFAGQWSEAIKSLERGKSLRLRYRAALSESPDGQYLLELETKLHALSRGVPLQSVQEGDKASDWLGEKIPLRDKVLEAYRKQRPVLPDELLVSPSIRDIAALLAQNEAVVLLGHSFKGILMSVVLPGDEDMPSGHFLFEDWPNSKLVQVLAGEHKDGWIFAVGAPKLKIDRKQALARLLTSMEEAIGKPLGIFLKEREVHRVTIIPHSLLHQVPFWALPSMADFEILMSPSAAHFIKVRQHIKTIGHKALIVADPTLDLPVSPAEAEAARQHLSSIGWEVKQLQRKNATEEVLIKEIADASLFHFCGHGRSDLVQPTRSSLFVHPDLSRWQATGTGTYPDPFQPLVSAVSQWQEVEEDERYADLPGHGRLCEKLDAKKKILERWLEYSETGTLWGRYQNNKLVMLAELWMAGDIMVQGSVRNCRLAFLAACESGSRAIEQFDEYSGLPAAFQLAGVSTVISTLWPVSDATAALYVELFYKALAQSSHKVNIASLVRHVGECLCKMSKEEAMKLLSELRGRTLDPEARFRLEVFSRKISKGETLPFNHPYEWAAFYVTGAGDLILSKEDSHAHSR